MADIEHSTIADPNIHEPKGVAAADEYTVYVADGAGTGTWQLITSDSFDTGVGDTFATALLQVTYKTTSGSPSDDITAGSWQQRKLNTTVTNEISGASLGSNRITLPAGTYWIDADSHFSSDQIATFQSKLYNVTDTTDTVFGTLAQCTGRNLLDYDSTRYDFLMYDIAHSRIKGRFTTASSKVFEIRTYSTQAGGCFDFYSDYLNTVQSFDATSRTYHDVCIWKVA